MSGDIVLSAGVRSNLLALQNTASLMAQTQERLSSGKKVNSALDNPINFFTASALTNRASDISGLLDGVGNAIQTLQAADNGIKAIKQLVQTAQAAARQALQTSSSTARYTGTVSNLTGSSSFAVTATKTITINDGTTTATITSGGTVTVQDVIDGVNNAVGLNVKASLTSDGKLLLEGTGANTIVIGGTASAPELAQFGLVAGTTAAGTINSARSNFAAQYDTLRTQIDKLAQDASFNGVDLIYGNGLKVLFNEQSTSSLTIAGVMLDSTDSGWRPLDRTSRPTTTSMLH
jgi:flagellin